MSNANTFTITNSNMTATYKTIPPPLPITTTTAAATTENLGILQFSRRRSERQKGKAEEILAEEQAGFRPQRNTVEQILNTRLFTEKHLQHQTDLYQNFIDFKKAFIMLNILK
uniref:Uncharacterized protein n=1 Tax=Octopus bimaculoides TaxID=37653 RepID=A0A0L8GMR6_OCTBM